MIKRDQGQSTGALELDGNQQRTRQLDYLIILNDKRALPYEHHKRKQNMMIFGTLLSARIRSLILPYAINNKRTSRVQSNVELQTKNNR